MKKRLNEATIEKATPPAKGRLKVWDSAVPGLFLEVTPAGRKSFYLAFRLNRVERRMRLGDATILTLAEARKEAAARLGDVARGEDPLAVRTAKPGQTLAEFWPVFVKEKAKRWKPKTEKEFAAHWKRDILPKLGGKTLREITRRDVILWHGALKSKPTSANRGLALIKQIFNVAKAQGFFEGDNPASRVSTFPETKRQRFLEPEELQRLLATIDAFEDAGRNPEKDEDGTKRRGQKRGENQKPENRGISAYLAGLFRLLIYTGARRSEFLTAKWEWVDWEARALRLPDSKTGEKTIVLNEGAVAELRRLRELRSQDTWIIEAMDGRGHFSDPYSAWQRVAKGAGLVGLRIHDLRHTFASQGLRAGVSLSIIGKMLGHADPKTTSRYAHLAESVARAAVEKIGRSINQAGNGDGIDKEKGTP